MVKHWKSLQQQEPFADANVGAEKQVTITYSLADETGIASNYSMASYTTTGSITAKQLTMTDPVLTLTKEYSGNATTAFTAGALSGVITNDEANVAVSAVASYDNANAGTGKTITVVYTISGTSSGNYVKPVDYVVDSGEITKKALTITADNQTVQFATPVATVTAAGTYTAAGFAGSEGAGVIGGTISYSTTYTDVTAAGTSSVTITPVTGGLTATNYSFTPVNGTITIVPLPQGSLTANSICASGTGWLTWTATSGTGLFTVVYNDGTSDHSAGNVESGVPFTTDPATVSSTTTYTLVSVTDASLAVRTASFTGGSATINVTPAISGNSSGSDITICDGTSTTLTPASVTGGTGSYTYLWLSGSTFNGSFDTALNTNDAANYSTGNLSTSSTQIYFKRKVISGSCEIYASPAKVTVVPCTTIDLPDIGGVTAPVPGATPVSTATETAQYTATVAWTPADATFQSGITYIATITITPKMGYTLTGVPSDFFKITDVTTSNAAGSGVVTATFPSL